MSNKRKHWIIGIAVAFLALCAIGAIQEAGEGDSTTPAAPVSQTQAEPTQEEKEIDAINRRLVREEEKKQAKEVADAAHDERLRVAREQELERREDAARAKKEKTEEENIRQQIEEEVNDAVLVVNVMEAEDPSTIRTFCSALHGMIAELGPELGREISMESFDIGYEATASGGPSTEEVFTEIESRC